MPHRLVALRPILPQKGSRVEVASRSPGGARLDWDGVGTYLPVSRRASPAVVIARIPATGWCQFADYRLPQTMIEVFLEAEASTEATDYGWDVMVARDIPAELIEAVVPPDDPMVAG